MGAKRVGGKMKDAAMEKANQTASKLSEMKDAAIEKAGEAAEGARRASGKMKDAAMKKAEEAKKVISGAGDEDDDATPVEKKADEISEEVEKEKKELKETTGIDDLGADEENPTTNDETGNTE